MPDPEPGRRVCPYLRGRQGPAPVLQPSPYNHCVLSASIHLPQAQQVRYCLGGRYPRCSRYERQQAQPLPLYITGAPAGPPPIMPPRPQLPTLLWRRPVWRTLRRLFFLLAVLGMMILGWRWQQAGLTPHSTPRPPLPTPIAAPTPDLSLPWLPPTYGPPAR